jgi:hypothetical protein
MGVQFSAALNRVCVARLVLLRVPRLPLHVLAVLRVLALVLRPVLSAVELLVAPPELARPAVLPVALLVQVPPVLIYSPLKALRAVLSVRQSTPDIRPASMLGTT